MSNFWVGYEDSLFIRASSAKTQNHTELLADLSGFPLFVEGRRVYVKHGGSAKLRAAARELFVPNLKMTLQKPAKSRASEQAVRRLHAENPSWEEERGEEQSSE